MSKIVKVQAPDGTIIKVEGPDDASDADFIQQGAALYQQQQQVKSRQTASTAEFEKNQPSLVGGFLSEAKQNAGKLLNVLGNTAPGAATGMDSPAVQFLAAATPGGAATKGMGLADAFTQSPAAQAVKAVRGLIPSAGNAGAKFEQVLAAAKDVPIDTGPADKIVSRAEELRQRGSTLPKVLRDYLKTTETPLTYETSRDFARNAGALSAREATAMNAPMHRQVAQFAVALKDANREAAAKVGMGELYDAAIKEYRQAKGIEDAGAFAKKWLIRAAIATTLYGTARRIAEPAINYVTGK